LGGLEGHPPRQKNEGKWTFTLDDSSDEEAVVLDVEIGQYLDVSQIKADVQPRLVRLLIKVGTHVFLHPIQSQEPPRVW
jgi:hypothetical protein